MVKIIYESHSTSEDNEKGIASGHFDPPLSEKGRIQAQILGKRYVIRPPQFVFCSDLKRSFQTATIAFPKIPKIKTSLLREWDYGVYNGESSKKVEMLKSQYIYTPFPGGEDLKSVVERILYYLDSEIKKNLFQNIMLVAHRSTFYALEHRYKKFSLKFLVNQPWTWQEGWIYLQK